MSCPQSSSEAAFTTTTTTKTTCLGHSASSPITTLVSSPPPSPPQPPHLRSSTALFTSSTTHHSLTFPCSSLAHLTGYHPYKASTFPSTFIGLVYQDDLQQQKLDCKEMGCAVVSELEMVSALAVGKEGEVMAGLVELKERARSGEVSEEARHGANA